MVALLVIIHVIVALFLVGVVLLQQGKSADLAGAFGGQGSQTAFGPRGAANLLTRLTHLLRDHLHAQFHRSHHPALARQQRSLRPLRHQDHPDNPSEKVADPEPPDAHAKSVRISVFPVPCSNSLLSASDNSDNLLMPKLSVFTLLLALTLPAAPQNPLQRHHPPQPQALPGSSPASKATEKKASTTPSAPTATTGPSPIKTALSSTRPSPTS